MSGAIDFLVALVALGLVGLGEGIPAVAAEEHVFAGDEEQTAGLEFAGLAQVAVQFDLVLCVQGRRVAKSLVRHVAQPTLTY